MAPCSSLGGVDACHGDSLIFGPVDGHQDNSERAPVAEAVHMSLLTGSTEHRPVEGGNLWVVELRRHGQEAVVFGDGVPDNGLMLLPVLKE